MLRIYRISGSNLIRNSQRFSPVKTNIAENLYNDDMYRYVARIIVIIICIWHIWQEIMTIINYRFWDSKDELSFFFRLCSGFLKFIEMKIVDQIPTSGIFLITYFRILTRAPSILAQRVIQIACSFLTFDPYLSSRVITTPFFFLKKKKCF